MYVPPNRYREILEEQVNKWARGISKNYKIKPASFRISIEQGEGPKVSIYGRTSHFPVIARVTNGIVVNIVLVNPWVDSKEDDDVHSLLMKSIRQLKTTVKRIFKYISTPKLNRDEDLFNPLIVSDVMHEYVLGERGIKVWKRKRYDPLKVKGHRRAEFKVEYTVIKKVKFIHKETNVSVEVVDHTNRPEWDVKQEAWIKCAELVEVERMRRLLIPINYDINARFVVEDVRVQFQSPYKIVEKKKKKKSIFNNWRPR